MSITILALALAFHALLPASERRAPVLEVNPAVALVDEPVQIVATGLEPGAEVTLTATLAVGPGEVLRAEAIFQADASGVVDVAQNSSRSGTYTGVDPMGLFWSMVSTPVDSSASLPPPCGPPWSCRILLELGVDGRVVASAGVERRFLAEGTGVVEVREPAVVGRLYLPPTPGRPSEARLAGESRLPVVIVVSGSEGGIPDLRAAILASRGFAAFALAYFRAEGLPDELFEIPVETVPRGIAWLESRPEVDAKRIAILGQSKGAELALLAASTYAMIDAVVAYAPTAFVWPGIARDGSSRPVSSWSLGGAPVPFVPHVASPEFEAQFQRPPPWRLRLLYEPSVADSARAARGAIAVERIQGPVLLIAGEDDQMGPACGNAERIARRLERHGHPYPVVNLCYPGAGHAIAFPYLPTSPGDAGPFMLGGMALETARANADSWPRVIAFLRQALQQPSRQSRQPPTE